MYCVIMAGGSGTRFWPLSRNNNPKQLLNIIGEKSMLQITIDRLLKLKKIEDIFIITRSDLATQIIDQIKGIPQENIIIEPEGKNTAPCIALAALSALKEEGSISTKTVNSAIKKYGIDAEKNNPLFL